MPTYRPRGIAVLAVVAAGVGLYTLVGSLALLTIGGTAVGGWQSAVFAGGLVALAYAALSLVLGYGFWDLRPWAWPLGLAIQLLGVAQILIRWAAGHAGALEVVVVIALAAGVAWYLFRSEVREAFGRPGA